jgi:hypothetical protein
LIPSVGLTEAVELVKVELEETKLDEVEESSELDVRDELDTAADEDEDEDNSELDVEESSELDVRDGLDTAADEDEDS